MIFTVFGSEVQIISGFDGETQECRARRLRDGAIRTYRLFDLKADGGIDEILAAGEAASKTSGDAA